MLASVTSGTGRPKSVLGVNVPVSHAATRSNGDEIKKHALFPRRAEIRDSSVEVQRINVFILNNV